MAEKVLKYIVLKKEIVEKINNEEYKIGEMIPSEREFMDIYQLSRITVRKAIDDLVNEGYLYRIQGKGTYVKTEEHNYDLFSLTSCTQDIARSGMVVSRKIICAEVLLADKMRQRKLEIADGEAVLKLERVYYADGTPINDTTTYLPLSIFPGLDKYNFATESLYGILENEYGVKITNARRTIEAVLAHEEVAENLDVNEGEPLLLFRSITYGFVGDKEIAIETFKSHYRTDIYKFYLNQIRTAK